MGKPHEPDPVMLVVAAFSRHLDALAWARVRLEREYGPITCASPAFAFNQTSYYTPTMGADLRKQFFAFGELLGADRLAGVKLGTNRLEADLAASGRFPEVRPLNLDPGLLGLGKFMLATTKDQAHRIYLRDGIFAEVTLRYHAGSFEPWPWTYADYREPAILDFLKQARDSYRLLLGANRAERP